MENINFKGYIGLQQIGAPHIIKDSLPLGIFVLFFFKIIQLLVEERNRYHQYLGHPGRRMVPTA
jgi:hypothetical protein